MLLTEGIENLIFIISNNNEIHKYKCLSDITKDTYITFVTIEDASNCVNMYVLDFFNNIVVGFIQVSKIKGE